jgi:hypothetical protein
MFQACTSIRYNCGDAEIDSRHREMMDCLSDIHRAVNVHIPLSHFLLRRLAEEFSDLCSVHELAEQFLTIEHHHFFDHALIFDRVDDLLGAVGRGACGREIAEIVDSLHALLIADIITDQAEIRRHASDERSIIPDSFDFASRPLRVEPVNQHATAQ